LGVGSIAKLANAELRNRDGFAHKERAPNLIQTVKEVLTMHQRAMPVVDHRIVWTFHNGEGWRQGQLQDQGKTDEEAEHFGRLYTFCWGGKWWYEGNPSNGKRAVQCWEAYLTDQG
jgi:hypothetical protein